MTRQFETAPTSVPNIRKAVLSLILPIKSDKTLKIIDAGCGKGELASALARSGHEVICADIMNNLSPASGLEFRQADFNRRLPFQDCCFDIVVCTEVIEHLENPRHVMREFKRIVKNGGSIIISMPNVLHPVGKLYFLLTGHLYGFSHKQYMLNGHISPVSIHDMKQICGELELKIEKVRYNGIGKGVVIFKIRKQTQQ